MRTIRLDATDYNLIGRYNGDDDVLVLVDASLAPVVVTIPDAQNYYADELNVIKVDDSVNTVTIQSAVSGQLISGAATKIIYYQYDAASLKASDSDWWIS